MDKKCPFWPKCGCVVQGESAERCGRAKDNVIPFKPKDKRDEETTPRDSSQ